MFDANDSNYVATQANWVGADADAHRFDNSVASSNATLFIGEIQVGGQWNLPLKCMPANAFVRVAFEYQYWATSHSGYAEAISAAGPTDGPVVFAAGQSVGQHPHRPCWFQYRNRPDLVGVEENGLDTFRFQV